MSLFKLVGEVFVDTASANDSLSKVESAAEKAGKKLQKLGKTTKDAGDKITKTGKKLTKTVTAAVTGLGIASVKTAADFESGMSQVQATMGLASDSMSELNGTTVNTMDALSDLAKNMGSTTAFSASEAADAINYLALAGYDTQQIYDTLPTVLNLAAAGGMDLASASDMVTDAMSALGLETSDAETMVDQMAKTASSSNTSVEQLGEAILTIGATGKTVAGGTTELNTALGILANNGIKGSEGGTHLRNVILSLQKPTDKAAECMKNLGLDVYDAEGNMRPMNDILSDLNDKTADMTAEEKTNIIGRIFNKTDLAAASALLDNCGEAWDDLSGKIDDSAGAAQDMADTQLDNLNGQLTKMKSALEGASIAIGEQLMPYVKKGAEFLQKLVDKFNSLDDKQKQMIIKIALIAAAVGPVLMIIGTVVSGIGSIIGIIGTMMTTMAAGQGVIAALGAAFGAANIMAIAIVAGIAAVIAIGVLLYKNWDKIKAKAAEMASAVSKKWEMLKEAIAVKVKEIKAKTTRAFMEMKEKVSSTIENLKSTIKTKMDTIKSNITTPITNAVTTVKTKLGEIKTKFTEMASFKWMKIPHISVSGGEIPWGIGGMGTKPKIGISWYKKAMDQAMILDKPTLFGAAGDKILGAGEAGREVVSGEAHLLGLMQSAVSSVMSAETERIYNLLAEYLPAQKQIVMDSGALVGAITKDMNKSLAKTKSMQSRGVVYG